VVSQWAPHGFVCRKVASVAVRISTFESTVIYFFNHNRLPEILFSIYDTSEIVTALETALPNMALVCVPSLSAPNSQHVLPISAEPSLSTKSIILPSDFSPEEITGSRLFQKISLLPKIPRKYSIEKLQHTSSLKRLIISRKSERSKKEIKSKNREL
jgi:hypothetical protein